MAHELEVQDYSSEYYLKRYSGYGLKYHTHVITGMMEGISGRILDLGAGTGIISDLYPDLDIIGIDISEGMLKLNKHKCFIGSAENIKFPDNYFHAVVARSLLHHLPNAEAGLKEIQRVLRPGGKFICWDPHSSWLAEKVRKVTQHGDRFSELHHSFSDLPKLVSRYFKNIEVKYEGFLAYPFFGFPDICNFSKYLSWSYNVCLRVDEFLSKSWLKKMAFAVMIKAVK